MAVCRLAGSVPPERGDDAPKPNAFHVGRPGGVRRDRLRRGGGHRGANRSGPAPPAGRPGVYRRHRGLVPMKSGSAAPGRDCGGHCRRRILQGSRVIQLTMYADTDSVTRSSTLISPLQQPVDAFAAANQGLRVKVTGFVKGMGGAIPAILAGRRARRSSGPGARPSDTPTARRADLAAPIPWVRRLGTAWRCNGLARPDSSRPHHRAACTPGWGDRRMGLPAAVSGATSSHGGSWPLRSLVFSRFYGQRNPGLGTGCDAWSAVPCLATLGWATAHRSRLGLQRRRRDPVPART